MCPPTRQMITTSDETRELKSLGDNGAPPKTRVTDPAHVRDMFARAVEANKRRERLDALVKGMVDGNPPYEQAKLTAAGRRHQANFNNGEAEAFFGVAQTAFYDLFSEVDRLTNCTVDDTVAEANKFTDIVSEEFDWLLKQNDGLDYNVQLGIHDMVLYGTGPHIWEHPLDWRSKAVPHNIVFLPNQSKSDVTQWEKLFIQCDYRVDEAYAWIADPESAEKAGYNVKAIREAIKKAVPETVSRNWGNNWAKYQSWVRNNDIYAGDTCKMVRTVKMFFKEFAKDSYDEGKISEVIVYLDDNEPEFLFRDLECYDSWKQVICPFFWDRGDGTAHSVRGLGKKMFAMLLTKMRLQNAQVDAAFDSIKRSFRILGSASQTQMASIINQGHNQFVPAVYEEIPQQGMSRIEGSLVVARDLDNTLSQNLGQYRARTEKPEGNPRTAFEVGAELKKQSVLGKTQISRFYEQLDAYWAETFRRAISEKIPATTKNKWLKLALEFVKRVEARGVPKELLKTCRVTARRTVGQGSAYERMVELGNLFAQLFQVLPEDGRTNLTNDLIAVSAGREAVNRYNPAPELRTKESQQRWEAQIENDTLKNRGQVSLTPYQNDTIHAQEHLAFGSQAAGSLQQGANPMEILGILQSVGSHTALHLQRLSGNELRASEFKMLDKQWKQLASIADELESQIQQAQERQAQQAETAKKAQAVEDGTDPEIRLKAAETQAKLELKAQKQAADLALKQNKQQADIGLKTQQTRANIAMQDATTATKIQLDAAKAKSDAENASAKANSVE